MERAVPHAEGVIRKRGPLQTLFQDLEAATDQREDYYKYRALPFWKQVWPKSLDISAPPSAES